MLISVVYDASVLAAWPVYFAGIGRLSGSTETKLFRQPGSPLRVGRRDQGVIAGKLPPCSILVDSQAMSGPKMTSEHAAGPAAFEASHLVVLNGSPDRHCWSSFDDGFGNRLTEVGERLMNGRDQRRELVDRNLVALNIRGHDFRGEFLIGRCGRLLVGHLLSSAFGPQNTIPR